MGRRPEGRGPHRRADQGRPGVLRPVGPLRLRRRRQLQRARRLHRPLPDRPRRWRPGRRRPAAGRGRHLVAPLVRLPEHRPTGPATNKRGGTQIGNTGLWVGDYTIQPENGGLSRLRPRVRPRPRPAGPLRHRRRPARTPSNWWTLMAQSRRRRRATRASAPAPADLGAWDKLQLGWLDYEIVARRPEPDARPRPARVQLRRRPQGVVVVAAEEAGHDRPRRRRRRAPSSGGAAQGDDLDTHADASVTLPAGSVDADLPGQLGHRGLRSRPVRLRLRRGRRRRRLEGASRARSPSAAEGNGIDGASNGWVAGDVRPVGVRRQDGRRCGSATPPTVPRGHRPGPAAGIFADEITLTAGGDDGVHRRCRDRRQRLDARRLHRASAPASPTRTTTTTSRRTGTYVSYDQYLQTGPYNFGFAEPSRTTSSTSRTRTACSSPTGTPRSRDNNTSEHPGEGLILPIDAHPAPIYRLDGQAVARRGSRATTRRSGCEKADSFTLHVERPGELHPRPGRRAGVRRQPVLLGRRRSRRSGVKVPNAGVRIAVQSASGTSMRIRVSATQPAN